jgi:sugar-specific transcriptional regulator TrmB
MGRDPPADDERESGHALPDPTGPSQSESHRAIEALQQLGLTEYEAKCLVALVRLSQGTAKDISRVADIPRSRVYDAVDRLHRSGLVETRNSTPKFFRSVDIETVIRTLRGEYDAYFETIEESLRALEPTTPDSEQDVWSIEGHDSVSDRVHSLIREADSEVVLVVHAERLVDDDLLDLLREVAARGVSVVVGTRLDDLRERLDDGAGSISTFRPDLAELGRTSDGAALGRILVVDDEAILVSAVTGERLPGIPEETATWCRGFRHGFAIVISQLVRRELDRRSE